MQEFSKNLQKTEVDLIENIFLLILYSISGTYIDNKKLYVFKNFILCNQSESSEKILTKKVET